MKLGELSKRTGINIPTIRVYEREGLISVADRTEGRYRVFGEEQQPSALVFRTRDLRWNLASRLEGAGADGIKGMGQQFVPSGYYSG